MMSISPLTAAKAGVQDKSAFTEVSSHGLGSDTCRLFQPVLDPGLRRGERRVG